MFRNKKILILGFARSGYEAAKLLAKRGNEVVLNDRMSIEKMDTNNISELTSLGVTLVFGSHPDDLLDASFDYLIKNPGVPIDHKYVLKARKIHVPVINEVEMAYSLLPDNVKIVGITGTNGKTTTTMLIYNILKSYYKKKVYLAGNVGYPLSSIVDMVKDDDIIVLEVSCQQGENIEKFHPNIGVFTNLSEAHIDFMKTYNHYIYTKTKMFYNQSEKDIAIINYNDSFLVNELKGIKSKKRFFSSTNVIDGCYIDENSIKYYGEMVCSIDSIKLKGIHNLENCMAAVMVSKELGVPNEIICDVIFNFNGVEHRLEFVNTVGGVDYYNDTEATNIKCCQIALSSFKKPIVLILGGLDRGQNFADLTEYMDNVKAIIAIGECRDRIESYAKTIKKAVWSYEYLEQGFKKAQSLANCGDVVLLSPASASWDQYKQCEDRGDEFKQLISQLVK